MKFFFILSFFMLSVQIGADELTWVNEQIEAIRPPRNGVTDSEVSTLRDPFILVTKDVLKDSSVDNNDSTVALTGYNTRLGTKEGSYTISSKDFKLSAIINDSALINSKWVKLDEKVKGFTVSEIGLNDVILTKKSKKIFLSINSNILNLKLKSK